MCDKEIYFQNGFVVFKKTERTKNVFDEIAIHKHKENHCVPITILLFSIFTLFLLYPHINEHIFLSRVI